MNKGKIMKYNILSDKHTNTPLSSDLAEKCGGYEHMVNIIDRCIDESDWNYDEGFSIPGQYAGEFMGKYGGIYDNKQNMYFNFKFFGYAETKTISHISLMCCKSAGSVIHNEYIIKDNYNHNDILEMNFEHVWRGMIGGLKHENFRVKISDSTIDSYAVICNNDITEHKLSILNYDSRDLTDSEVELCGGLDKLQKLIEYTINELNKDSTKNGSKDTYHCDDEIVAPHAITMVSNYHIKYGGDETKVVELYMKQLKVVEHSNMISLFEPHIRIVDLVSTDTTLVNIN